MAIQEQIQQKQQELSQAQQALTALKNQLNSYDPKAAPNLPRYSMQQLQNSEYIDRQRAAVAQILQNYKSKELALASLQNAERELQGQKNELNTLESQYKDYQNALLEQRRQEESFKAARAAAYGSGSDTLIANLSDEEKEVYNAVRENRAYNEALKLKAAELQENLDKLSQEGGLIKNTASGYQITLPSNFNTRDEAVARFLNDSGFNMQSTKEGYILEGSKISQPVQTPQPAYPDSKVLIDSMKDSFQNPNKYLPQKDLSFLKRVDNALSSKDGGLPYGLSSKYVQHPIETLIVPSVDKAVTYGESVIQNKSIPGKMFFLKTGVSIAASQGERLKLVDPFIRNTLLPMAEGTVQFGLLGPVLETSPSMLNKLLPARVNPKPKIEIIKGESATKARQLFINEPGLKLIDKDILEGSGRVYKSTIGQGKQKTITYLIEDSMLKGTPGDLVGQRTFTGFTKDSKGKTIDVFKGVSLERSIDKISHIQTQFLSNLQGKNDIQFTKSLQRIQTVQESPFNTYLSPRQSKGFITNEEGNYAIIADPIRKTILTEAESREVSSAMLKRKDIDFSMAVPFYKKTGASVFFPKGEIPLTKDEFVVAFSKAKPASSSRGIRQLTSKNFVQMSDSERAESLIFFSERGAIKPTSQAARPAKPKSPWNIPELQVSKGAKYRQPKILGEKSPAILQRYTTSSDFGGLQREVSFYTSKGSPLSNTIQDISLSGYSKNLKSPNSPAKVYFSSSVIEEPVQTLKVSALAKTESLQTNPTQTREINILSPKSMDLSNEALVPKESLKFKFTSSQKPTQTIKFNESYRESQIPRESNRTRFGQPQRLEFMQKQVQREKQRTLMAAPLSFSKPSNVKRTKKIKPRFIPLTVRKNMIRPVDPFSRPYITISDAARRGKAFTMGTLAASFAVFDLNKKKVVPLPKIGGFSPSKTREGFLVQAKSRKEGLISGRLTTRAERGEIYMAKKYNPFKRSRKKNPFGL